MASTATSNKVIGGALMVGGVLLVFYGWKHFKG